MKRYDIVFTGEILLEKDLGDVKKGLSRLLKTDARGIEKLFSGDEVVLKRDVPEELAHKIRDAATTVGAVFDLRPSSGPTNSAPMARPSAAPPPGSETTPANAVSCPACGTSQPRAADCINCGAFLIKERRPSVTGPHRRPSPPPTAAPKGISTRSFFRGLRIFLLVMLLIMVASHTYLTRQRTTNWKHTLRVGIYPINGDDAAQTDLYINTLSEMTFEPIARFFAREAGRYGMDLESPVQLHLAPEVEQHPPEPPREASRLSIMLWSLKFRLWSVRADTLEDISPDVRMFVVYTTGGTDVRLDNSFGLQKGLAGVVHGFADRQFAEKNNLVLAHEILHTVGATDKYDPRTRQPIYPDGFAEPDRSPRYPQRWAEIMAGRVPEAPNRAEMPFDLDYAVVGEETAREIRWLKSEG